MHTDSGQPMAPHHRFPKQPHAVFYVTHSVHVYCCTCRDTRSLLASASEEDACQFINDNTHPRLWRILAEHSLQRLDFTMAEKAFVHSSDYQVGSCLRVE